MLKSSAFVATAHVLLKDAKKKKKLFTYNEKRNLSTRENQRAQMSSRSFARREDNNTKDRLQVLFFFLLFF